MILDIKTLKEESVDVDPTKMSFKTPDSMELLLDEFQKEFRVGVHIATKDVGVSSRHTIYSSPDRAEAEKQYQTYLEAFKSKNYHLTIDPSSNRAEFLIKNPAKPENP